MGKKGKNSNYKQYPINCIEDVLTILGNIIIAVMYNLDKYIQYNNELMNMIMDFIEYDFDKNEIISINLIPEKEFNDLDDKIMYRQMEMLKFLADEQKSSFSYKNLRTIAKKKGYIKNELSEEVSKILNEFLQIRNWSFHNTQSTYTAAEEVAQKSIPSELKNIAKAEKIFNPVIGFVPEFYDISFVWSLELHMKKRIKDVKEVIDCMKADYIDLYKQIHLGYQNIVMLNGKMIDTTDVQFLLEKSPQPKSLFDMSNMEKQISMAIQKSKYDGSDKVFKQWTGQNSKTE